jgi:hypothetical protein
LPDLRGAPPAAPPSRSVDRLAIRRVHVLSCMPYTRHFALRRSWGGGYRWPPTMCRCGRISRHRSRRGDGASASRPSRPTGRGAVPSSRALRKAATGARADRLFLVRRCRGAVYQKRAAGRTAAGSRAGRHRLCPAAQAHSAAADRLDPAGFSYWAVAVAALFEGEASAFKDGAPRRHPSSSWPGGRTHGYPGSVSGSATSCARTPAACWSCSAGCGSAGTTSPGNREKSPVR